MKTQGNMALLKEPNKSLETDPKEIQCSDLKKTSETIILSMLSEQKENTDN